MTFQSPSPLPAVSLRLQGGLAQRATGLSFKPEHLPAIQTDLPKIEWFEVHPENYLEPSTRARDALDTIAALYPLSFHGVGASLGGSEPLDQNHLSALVDLVRLYEPVLVSEHLAWSAANGHYYTDLLPVPMTGEALGAMSAKVDQFQQALGRQVLIENPSLYGKIPHQEFQEVDFLEALCEVTGCGLLLDINNVFVSARNLGFDAWEYLSDFPGKRVGEVHLAGHAEAPWVSDGALIDTHGTPVSDPVWALYQRFCSAFGDFPTLIEWDTDVPAFETLLAEGERLELFRCLGDE